MPAQGDRPQPPQTITIVLPTYNRAAALRANLGSTLALDGVEEVIVVDDGSQDDTTEVCEAFEEPRMRLVRHPRNLGVAAARNTGIANANGAWILFSEDDCSFPSDYASVLRDEALLHRADVMGAPLLNVAGAAAEVAEIAARARRAASIAMDGTSTFPLATVETPFVPARALVRATVFERVRFHDGFPVNGYREETDFFVQAARAGFRCMVTPATYCYQAGFWDGGQHHGSTLRYEYWAARNNWHFLARHERWLVEQGHIAGATRAQLAFVAARARQLAAGAARARLRRARRALRRQRFRGRV
ncbi:MAG: glycosyltransferase family 2 protein [Solirubrobacteraceae bacterium]